ncbi:triphosphoribosyl-dephospho-CoA synthase MdcB [Paraburkholderia tuberum]|uniref:triphosphoribosyl-dephospho-CoA synthase n=1 Tax=Paraburkholderia tuberum TaxID=157910 RepID=A0A1H1KFL8_9BURK|nr:triphosphoribosyl-dephospho-CoA synthase MdcB [Paraburkholderia tuberum]SDR61138.1 triphosphoribosyl-dephospho-CoA synthase [Paraburkholderia tuberum]
MSLTPDLAQPSSGFATDEFACAVARAAIGALYAEVMLDPKPGLVTRSSDGSHRDMSAALFVRSLFALRHYFARIARAGEHGAPFDGLRRLGIEAECAMSRATRGVNTHRGAIFTLGLLAAAAGALHAQGAHPDVNVLCATVSRRYGAAILASHADARPSHGTRVNAVYGIAGAREVAAHGFRVLCEAAFPALEGALANGLSRELAAVQTLFAVMAVLDDTNLFHRGGRAGVEFVKRESRAFLAEGGVLAPNWRQRASSLNAAFMRRNLSPGGAADMLSATLFIRALQSL